MNERLLWPFRRLMLRRQFALSSHWSSLIYSDCTLEGHNYVGKNVICQSSSLGRYSYINNSTKVLATNIGRFSCIGPECLVGGLGAHPADRLSTHRMFYSKSRTEWLPFCLSENFAEKQRAIIGNDVWIGARAVIMDGVKVGDGAIVAAGGIVTRDVPPYAIVGGVPAKMIRSRFSSEIVDKLIGEAWWNLDMDALHSKVRNGDFSSSLVKQTDDASQFL